MTPETVKLVKQIGDVFTPSAPVDDAALFAGRIRQIREIIDAATQRGRHAIVFGERGVGKTSLANVLYDLVMPIMNASTFTKVNCEAASGFDALWRSIFRQLFVDIEKRSTGFHAAPELESMQATELLPPEGQDLSPEDVRIVLEQMDQSIVIIIDELDRITSKVVIASLADTLKTLSDNATPCTLILIGVADSVDELIEEHASIERALVQIHMPRMSPHELLELINKGLLKLGIKMDENIRKKIAKLSQGLPSFTHALCANACKNAAYSGRAVINVGDLEQAIKQVVEGMQQSIKRAYHTATLSPRENLFSEVLLSCALAPCDELGYFAAADLRLQMLKVTGKEYEIPAFSQHLKEFCETKRGAILQRVGTTRRFRFRFKNPLFSPYVIMKGLSAGLIQTSDVMEDTD